jgi:hypothetical protein
MASSGKRKTTIAKLTRERKLLERRLDKQARKEARKRSAADHSVSAGEGTVETTDYGDPEPTVEPAAPEAVVPASPDA